MGAWTTGRARRLWRVRGGAGNLTAILRGDLRGGDIPVANPPGLQALVRRWVSEPVEQAAIIQILKAVYGHVPNPPHPDLLAQGLENAFRRGDLLLLTRVAGVRGDSGGGGGHPLAMAAAGAAPALARQRAQEKTWVQFELVDAEGAGIGGARYRLQLPDGSVREGSLDGDGSVRVPNIDPGTCQISFPDIDAGEWKAA